MIARIWHGRVPAEKAEAYLEYLRGTGLADYSGTPGNRGVYVLQRIEDGVAHFDIVTHWESWDAIRAFAGDEVEVARYYPEDDDFLLEREAHVRHHQVIFSAESPPG